MIGGVHSGEVGSIILYRWGREPSGRNSPLHWGGSTKLAYIEGKLTLHSPPLWETLLLDDCFCWFLRSNQVFILWSHFFNFFLHCSFHSAFNYGSSLRECIRMNIFLLFTMVYSKINRNFVKTIWPWQQFFNTC